MVSLTFRQLQGINSLLMHMRIWHDKNISDHPNAMQVTYLSGLPQRKRESNVLYNHTQIGHSCRDTWTSRQVSNFYGVVLEIYYGSQIPLTIERFELWTSYPLETAERRHWRRSGVFIVNFEHISHRFLVFLMLLWTSKS